MNQERLAVVLLAVLVLIGMAFGQSAQLELGDGPWGEVDSSRPMDPDEATIRNAWATLLSGQPAKARSMLNTWLRENRGTGNQWAATALLVRGDAKAAQGNEYDALFDYEEIQRNFPGTPEYVQAAERVLAISVEYLEGKRRKFLGMRIIGAQGDGEELLVRISERLPGSQLAERAQLELGAYYRRIGEFAQAREVYGIFLESFPNSTYYRAVLLARIEATFAQYNGPQYDGSSLLETLELLDLYVARYPGDLEVQAELDALRVRIDESQGQQVLGMARVYLLRNEKASARYVLRRLLRDHPRTTAAREGLEILRDRGWLSAGDVP
ncbi:MAG: tetratricopeptide repeat protein [Phycisphaeraceae bacterium]|nr:tetratricopeptide repeat protein [Phycisphaeraceae bacterium]